jgi:hypothetical protein
MFLDNKYTRWYNTIVSAAKLRQLEGDVYVERHHIIPRSLGGNNSLSNLVALTAREHFVCHLLLTKMVDGNLQRKMIYAITAMSRTSGNQKRYVNSRLFNAVKKKRTHSEETKALLSKSHTGLVQTKETIEKRVSKMRGKVSPIKGKQTQTEQSKIKIGEAQKTLLSKMAPAEKSTRMKKSCSSPESWTQERKDKIGAAVRAAALRRKGILNDTQT